jgi:hypothetical protein
MRDPVGGVRCWMPRVEVGVEVEHGDGFAVELTEGSQSRESETVVAAKGDKFGMFEIKG